MSISSGESPAQTGSTGVRSTDRDGNPRRITRTVCRVCGHYIDRPDLTPEPEIHGSCYIEEGRTMTEPVGQSPDEAEADFNPGIEAVLNLFGIPDADRVSLWIDSLREDHNGLVWTTKAELRAVLTQPEEPVP